MLLTASQRVRFAIQSLLRLCGSLMPRRHLKGTPVECVIFRPAVTEIVQEPPGRINAVIAGVPVILDTPPPPPGLESPPVRHLPLHLVRSVFESGGAADASWVFQLKRCDGDDPLIVHVRPRWPAR